MWAISGNKKEWLHNESIPKLRVVLPTYKLIFHFHFPETKKVPKICHFYLWQFLTLTYKLKQRVLLSRLGMHKNQLQAENSISVITLSTAFLTRSNNQSIPTFF